MNYKDKYKMIVLYFKDSPEDRKRVDWLKSCGTSMNEEVKRLIDLAISLETALRGRTRWRVKNTRH